MTDETENPMTDDMVADLRNHRDDLLDVHGEPVHEDDDVIVFADQHGYELGEWADHWGIERSDLAAWMHHRANEVCSWNWSTSDPVVVPKGDA